MILIKFWLLTNIARALNPAVDYFRIALKNRPDYFLFADNKTNIVGWRKYNANFPSDSPTLFTINNQHLRTGNKVICKSSDLESDKVGLCLTDKAKNGYFNIIFKPAPYEYIGKLEFEDHTVLAAEDYDTTHHIYKSFAYNILRPPYGIDVNSIEYEILIIRVDRDEIMELTQNENHK